MKNNLFFINDYKKNIIKNKNVTKKGTKNKTKVKNTMVKTNYKLYIN